MADDKKETDTILCNWCKRPTTHILRARNRRPRLVGEGEVEEGGQPADIITSIWTCAGCDAATFEERMIMVEDGDLGPLYFPPRYDETLKEVSDRIEPKHFRQLNPVLTRIYNEVIKTFNEDCLVLCTMGLRALTEGICDDKDVRAKDLNGMIDGFVRLVPNLNIIDALHAFRHLGNEAAHDLEGLSRENARLAIEFMGEFLSSLYELDNKAQKVRNLSPKAAFRSAKPDSVQ
jgi:Domain of unknown function (DUF4145)